MTRFETALSSFAHAWIGEERSKREADQQERQYEAEIRWLRREIGKEELRARRQPRAARRVAQLVHEIRDRELHIAFLREPRS